MVFLESIFLTGGTLRFPFPVVLKLVEVPRSWGIEQDFRDSLPYLLPLPSCRAILLQSVSYIGLPRKALLTAVEDFLQTFD